VCARTLMRVVVRECIWVLACVRADECVCWMCSVCWMRSYVDEKIRVIRGGKNEKKTIKHAR
jgi:hypothetical protein